MLHFLNRTIIIVSLLINSNAYYFGDSITLGFNGSTIMDGWVGMINPLTGTTERNYGVSSMSLMTGHTPNFTSVYTTNIPQYHSDSLNIIYFAFGVNDIYTNTYSNISDFIVQYQTIIDHAVITKGWPRYRIVIFNCYYFTLGQSDQTKILTMNTAIKSFCQRNGLIFYDVYSQMVNNGGDSLLSSDHVHPTTSGYTVISNGLNNLLQKHFYF